jgi:hypothetical protein
MSGGGFGDASVLLDLFLIKERQEPEFGADDAPDFR